MKKPYKIRKMLFICKNGRIIEPNVHMTNAYQYSAFGEKLEITRQLSVYEQTNVRIRTLP